MVVVAVVGGVCGRVTPKLFGQPYTPDPERAPCPPLVASSFGERREKTPFR